MNLLVALIMGLVVTQLGVGFSQVSVSKAPQRFQRTKRVLEVLDEFSAYGIIGLLAIALGLFLVAVLAPHSIFGPTLVTLCITLGALVGLVCVVSLITDLLKGTTTEK